MLQTRYLTSGLIACANIMEGVTSLYMWEGKKEEASEVMFFAKTTAAKAKLAIDVLTAVHPYSCPCVVTWPIGDGNPEYLRWVVDQVK